MALIEKIIFVNSNKTAKTKKPYKTEVEASCKCITFFDESTKKNKKVLHLYNVSSRENKTNSNHKRQCVDLDENSAHQLLEIIKSNFNF